MTSSLGRHYIPGIIPGKAAEKWKVRPASNGGITRNVAGTWGAGLVTENEFIKSDRGGGLSAVIR